jgi:aryl-alcohol dehydrogenase-like predicted oxidoreductase
MQNIAKENRWHRFISMQNYHNLLYREEEREMIPYCNDTGVGLIPWSPLARGLLSMILDCCSNGEYNMTNTFSPSLEVLGFSSRTK